MKNLKNKSRQRGDNNEKQQKRTFVSRKKLIKTKIK